MAVRSTGRASDRRQRLLHSAPVSPILTTTAVTEADGAGPTPLLRPLAAADLEDCCRLDRLALDGFWSEAQWASELAAPLRGGMGLWRVDAAGGSAALQAMACGWLILDELHITLVAVDPAVRRCGLGRRVLAALLERAAAGGALRATLEVAVANAAALGLYGELGFRTAGVRRDYYRDGSDALIQWVRLDQRV